jgi:GT2 family glycosyltransferase
VTCGQSPELSILVVSYNTASLTSRCLASLPLAARRTAIEVVVVDNASSDGSVELLRAAHPAVTLVANEENVGFARAVNLAARHARAPFLLLLNPDTVSCPGSIDRLLEFAREHPGHGLYGGRTVGPDGQTDPRSCWGQQSLWSLACFATMADAAWRGSRLLDPESLGGWRRDSVREVGIVTGCFLLVEREAWDRLGGFDERFFMYGEDADLSLRARRSGYRPVVTPDAEVMHLGGGSPIQSERKQVLLLAARATIVRRRWTPWRARIGVWLLLAGVATRSAVSHLSWVDGRRSVWRGAWRCREEWASGYPPVGEAAALERER